LCAIGLLKVRKAKQEAFREICVPFYPDRGRGVGAARRRMLVKLLVKL
jgi:hypothetical protein